MSFTKFDRANKKILKKFKPRGAADVASGKTFPNLLIRPAPNNQFKKVNNCKKCSLVAVNTNQSRKHLLKVTQELDPFIDWMNKEGTRLDKIKGENAESESEQEEEIQDQEEIVENPQPFLSILA